MIKARTSVRSILCRWVPTMLMIGCLLLLTGSNFLLYPPSGAMSGLYQPAKDHQPDPQGPVEEKPASANSLSIQEEYVHETEHIHPPLILVSKSTVGFHAVEKTQDVPFELHTPPPKRLIA